MTYVVKLQIFFKK